MISTRVMDIKLREAAEGLGEDGAGETPQRALLWGWGELCLVAWSLLCSFLCGEEHPSPPYLVCSDIPQLHAVSGKTTASPLNAIWQHCFLAALPKSGVFVFFFFLEANMALLLT